MRRVKVPTSLNYPFPVLVRAPNCVVSSATSYADDDGSSPSTSGLVATAAAVSSSASPSSACCCGSISWATSTAALSVSSRFQSTHHRGGSGKWQTQPQQQQHQGNPNSPHHHQQQKQHQSQHHRRRGGGGQQQPYQARGSGFGGSGGQQQQSSRNRTHHHSNQRAGSQGIGSSASSSPQEQLERRFGVHARLVVRPHQQPRHNNRDAEGQQEAPPNSAQQQQQQHCFKASITFRQLGFPVEAAVATGATEDEARERVFEMAMDSNIVHITNQNSSAQPAEVAEVRQVIDELRNRCQVLGRALKFSVKQKEARHLSSHRRPAAADDDDAAAAAAEGESPLTEGPTSSSAAHVTWGCRAYVRDDWSVNTNLVFLYEAKSDTPNDALVKCFHQVCERYRREMESPEFYRAQYDEVVTLLKSRGKDTHDVLNVIDEFSAPPTPQEEGTTGDAENIGNDVDDPQQQQQPHTATPSAMERLLATVSQSDGHQPNSLDSGASALYPSLLNNKGTRYTVTCTVTSQETGNSYTVRASDQPSLQAAYNGIAAQILDSEGQWSEGVVERAAYMPFLLRLRWQAEGMAHHVADMQGLYDEEESSNQQAAAATGLTDAYLNVATLSLVELPNEVNATAEQTGKFQRPIYRAEGKIGTDLVAQAEGHGPYKAELDAYIQLTNALIDRYPEVAQYHFSYLFPTQEVLERDAAHHNNYRLFNHKGAWTCYNVLGTICSTLIGSYYQQRIQDLSKLASESKVIVNDGHHSDRVLMRRIATNRGYGWREATMDAIKYNFPNQHEQAMQRNEDFDRAGDIAARGSKYRALPREKRVQHVNQLFGIIAAFGEEDYGWRAPRVRVRVISGDAPRFVAEVEVHVEGETHRRAVCASPICVSAKVARRVVIYNACKQFFPNELAAYNKLGRSDGTAPGEVDDGESVMVYRATSSVIAQALDILDRHQPDLAPFTWRLEPYVEEGDPLPNDGSGEELLRPLQTRYKATIFVQNGDSIVVERLSDPQEGALAALRSVLKAAIRTFTTASNEGETLFREYETIVKPPSMASPRDLAGYLFSTFLGDLGCGTGRKEEGSAAGVFANSESTHIELREVPTGEGEIWWVATMVLPNMSYLPIARVASKSKKDALRNVWLHAARQSFAKQLRHYSKTHLELQVFADQIFHEPILLQPQIVLVPSSSTASGSAAEAARRLTPHQLLTRCVSVLSGGQYVAIHEHIVHAHSSTFECIVYRHPAKANTNKVGGGLQKRTSQVQELGRWCG